MCMCVYMVVFCVYMYVCVELVGDDALFKFKYIHIQHIHAYTCIHTQLASDTTRMELLVLRLADPGANPAMPD